MSQMTLHRLRSSAPQQDSEEAIVSAANLLRNDGRFDAADDLLVDGAVRYPDSFWIAAQHAWVASGRGDWHEALRRWVAISSRFPATSIAAVGRGEALRELGEIEEADSTLEDAIASFPEEVMPYIHYAWNATKRGNWSLALSRWQALVGRFPGNLYGSLGEIEALLELDRFDDAGQAIERAQASDIDRSSLLALQARLDDRSLALRDPALWVANEIKRKGIDLELPGRLANPEVLIEITSICNFACTYCVSPMKLREKKQMSMDKFREVMAEVATLTNKPVGLHVDGEPTSHPLFKEMALHVNSYGLPISLATNGSHLDPSFLEIWMDPLISMSTLPEELAKRHSKLNFDAYIERILRYVTAWTHSAARQNVFFQIVHYPQGSAEADQVYKKRKDEFLIEFCRRANLHEQCTEETSVEDDFYCFRRKGNPGSLTFIKQNITMEGLYPVDGKLVVRERATAGFCDSPWRMVVVHSDGTLGACCSDLSGGTTFATADEVQSSSIKEQWENSPRIRSMRQSFLEGRVELDVCQRCIKQRQVFFAVRDDQPPIEQANVA